MIACDSNDKLHVLGILNTLRVATGQCELKEEELVEDSKCNLVGDKDNKNYILYKIKEK